MIGCIIAALALRFPKLGTYPLGMHYDEAIDLWAGLQVQAGERPIYIERGWGREAISYYLLGAVLQVVPDNMTAFRLACVLWFAFTMIPLYLLVRRKEGVITAGFTLAWFTVPFWSLYISRIGLRAMALVCLLTLSAFLFWQAWDSTTQKMRWYLLAGISFGLTLYTYQPIRFAPFLFLGFLGYAALFHRQSFQQNWRGTLLFAVTALLIVLPLVLFIRTHALEGDRLWTIEPLTQLLQGNITPVWQNSLATAKMFSWQGDPLVSYNIPHRPIFVPSWTSLFFYAGLVLALWSWRGDAFSGFMLLWLGVMYAPTILTISAPNHHRAVGALVAVAYLAARPIGAVIQRLSKQWQKSAVLLFSLVAVVLVGQRAYVDYYTIWPFVGAGWEKNYNASVIAAIDYLQKNDDSIPSALISSYSIEDAHPTLAEVLLEQPNLQLRWSNSGQAFGLPAGHTSTYWFVASDQWIDQALSAKISQQTIETEYTPYFSLREASFDQWQVGITPLSLLPTTSVSPQSDAVLQAFPITLAEKVQLLNVLEFPETLPVGQSVTFFTTWSVLRADRGRALAMFVHLLDEQGGIVAQQDGLGYPLHTWRTGDRFLHVHHLAGETLPAGRYWVQLGIYEHETGQRWLIPLSGGGQADRIILGQVTLTP